MELEPKELLQLLEKELNKSVKRIEAAKNVSTAEYWNGKSKGIEYCIDLLKGNIVKKTEEL